MKNTANLRIAKTTPLLTPALLEEEFPCSEDVCELVAKRRTEIESILDGNDDRLLVVVGPCSIHDLDSANEYAERLRPVAEELSERLLIIMRVYFEKPRTVIGWKGLINDPDLDGSYRINKGLRQARKLLVDVAQLGLGAGTEFLDTTFGQFYADLISWGAIGARTAESQIHRELASGLSMPVGIKNRTDGNIQVAVDAIQSAQSRHLFPSLTKEGAPAILETTGNPYCHVVLRGGSETGPNYESKYVNETRRLLRDAELVESIMIDCSHGNSAKDPERQALVVDSIQQQIRAGETAIRALMIESHLNSGRQNHGEQKLLYGQSITDGCLGFEDTIDMLRRLAETHT
ncbi:MAG: 3-deoxy-7-phosphoheptulonate synthase [Pirellulaceae bacterium]|jgi:3-deoxy-7-phosphoheptulonate synthase